MPFKNLSCLAECLGNPPENSQAISLAIQALLFNRKIIFIRVHEEGFATKDYIQGLKKLQKRPLNALLLPGVGDREILQEGHKLCKKTKSLLLMTEQDLYDYLTL